MVPEDDFDLSKFEGMDLVQTVILGLSDHLV